MLNRLKDFLFYDKYKRYSYSQEGEDLIIRKIFKNQKFGFYVDVGAHHPKRFSNTYLLYKKGWHGINIDATPESMKLFNRFRPRDINLELGVGTREKFINYYIFNESALNSFSPKLSQKRNKKKNNQIFIKNKVKVQVKPLYKILDAHLSNPNIDILNIDVEGMDLDVLNSNDWLKYRPKFVLVEVLKSNFSDMNKNKISQFMEKRNYFIFSKLINVFFFKDRFAKK
jgi:FkbM family methyltransferase